jgi:hypothetical protein
VFTDFGSGKGPAVLVAATFPFARDLGVEVSDDLTRSARRNLERSRLRPRAGTVEFVTADVLQYEIPDDLSVVYLYNPFTGLLFARFLERLPDSLERRPRPLRLVYNYPFEHDHVIASGRFRPIDLSSSYSPAWYRRPGYVILTYEALTPQGEPYGVLPGNRSSPERLGPWRDGHDPGWAPSTQRRRTPSAPASWSGRPSPTAPAAGRRSTGRSGGAGR